MSRVVVARDCPSRRQTAFTGNIHIGPSDGYVRIYRALKMYEKGPLKGYIRLYRASHGDSSAGEKI